MKKHTGWCTNIGISLCARADPIALRILKKKLPKQNWVVYHSNSVFQKINLMLQTVFIPLFHVSSATVYQDGKW